MSYPSFLSRIERDIRDERERQDARWGEQNHPDGTGPSEALPGRTDLGMKTMANAARSACQYAARLDLTTWRHVLLEEVFEACAEEDPAKLRTELIQVAAVAMAWAEAIDRRQTTATSPGDHDG